MAGSTSEQPRTAEEYAAAQAAEWTTYVARVPIDYYGQRAYNAGDPVPVSAVGDDPAAGRWVPADFVRQVSDEAPAFAESTVVVDPAPPTVDPGAVAAPVVATPDPITTTEG